MKIYGLIGRTLSHSFSKKYFSQKFQREQIDNCIYQNFEIEDLELQIPLLKANAELCGLNVTIPYKTEIFPFLDQFTTECKELNACNCIKIESGKWIGYNTDVMGFQNSFASHLKPYHTKALVLGTGGASKAVTFVLRKLGISFLEVTRDKTKVPSAITYDDISKEILAEYTMVINTTPLGMFPNVDAYPKIPYRFITDKHYFFDLIYNPAKTLFLARAEEKGAIIKNGEKMLVIQAEESWKIWR